MCETGVNQTFQPLRKNGVVWANYTLCRELACPPPPPGRVTEKRANPGGCCPWDAVGGCRAHYSRGQGPGQAPGKMRAPATTYRYAPSRNGALPTAGRESHCSLPKRRESSCGEIPPPPQPPQPYLQSCRDCFRRVCDGRVASIDAFACESDVLDRPGLRFWSDQETGRLQLVYNAIHCHTSQASASRGNQYVI